MAGLVRAMPFIPGGHTRRRKAVAGIKTADTARYYFNVAYSHRTGAGYTPFIFDRVEIPQEIFTEVEFPVPFLKNGLWRLGAWNRDDTTTGMSPDFSIMGIYQEDCLAYALVYDRLQKSISVKVVLTASGTSTRVRRVSASANSFDRAVHHAVQMDIRMGGQPERIHVGGGHDHLRERGEMREQGGTARAVESERISSSSNTGDSPSRRSAEKIPPRAGPAPQCAVLPASRTGGDLCHRPGYAHRRGAALPGCCRGGSFLGQAVQRVGEQRGKFVARSRRRVRLAPIPGDRRRSTAARNR